jgi:hypothetical protein
MSSVGYLFWLLLPVKEEEAMREISLPRVFMFS